MKCCQQVINHIEFWCIPLNGCTSWILTKKDFKILHKNSTCCLKQIVEAIKKKKQHKKQLLHGHLPPISQTIQVSRTWHAGHYRRTNDELISDVLKWTLLWCYYDFSFGNMNYCEKEVFSQKGDSFMHLYIYIYIGEREIKWDRECLCGCVCVCDCVCVCVGRFFDQLHINHP